MEKTNKINSNRKRKPSRVILVLLVIAFTGVLAYMFQDGLPPTGGLATPILESPADNTTIGSGPGVRVEFEWTQGGPGGFKNPRAPRSDFFYCLCLYRERGSRVHVARSSYRQPTELPGIRFHC